MSSFGVFVEKIGVMPHPNADRLDLANVGLYKAVVEKGKFTDGEMALYLPEQSILPEWLIKELNLEGKLAGGKANRVKAVKLRGVLSQGIAVKLDVLNLIPDNELLPVPVEEAAGTVEVDFAEALGVTKWKVEVPLHLTGDMMAEPNTLLPWTDMENIHRYPDIFEDGEEVILTEKIHGTCLISTTFFDEEVERTAVVSKGLAHKGVSFKANESNTYWNAVQKNPVRDLAVELKGIFEEKTGSPVVAVGVYGEVFGKGIQDLAYGTEGGHPEFRAFDAQIRFAGGETAWVDTDVLRGAKTPILHVPMIWRGAYSIEAVAEHAGGKEQVSGNETNLREGVVIRPADASRTWGAWQNPRRKIAKFVTEAYLTRKNGTEFN